MIQVLIAEDDKAHGEVIKDYLHLSGINSHLVLSGNEAIDWLIDFECQLILSDIRMPNGSGIDLIRWNSREGRKLPMVAMSGDAKSENETRQFCEVMEVPYLAKPLNLSDLRKLISDIINN